MPFHGLPHHPSLTEASHSPSNLLRLNSSKIHCGKTFWYSVVWVTSVIISLLLCCPPSFLPLGLYWAFCRGHSSCQSLAFENARRGTFKVYLGFSFYWIWHLWPITINISKWIVSKEMIHTNNNFVKTYRALPDSERSAALGSRNILLQNNWNI